MEKVSVVSFYFQNNTNEMHTHSHKWEIGSNTNQLLEYGQQQQWNYKCVQYIPPSSSLRILFVSNEKENTTEERRKNKQQFYRRLHVSRTQMRRSMSNFLTLSITKRSQRSDYNYDRITATTTTMEPPVPQIESKFKRLGYQMKNTFLVHLSSLTLLSNVFAIGSGTQTPSKRTET